MPSAKSSGASESFLTWAASASCYGFFYNAGLQFQDSFCVERLPNQHEIVSGTAASGGSPNLYQRYLCDGDGFYNFDAGDMIQDWGTYTLKNSLGMNFCGAMTTISQQQGSRHGHQNTNYNSFGGDVLRDGMLRRRPSGISQ